MVQTFLPYPKFRDSAIALDKTRLGKQRLEVVWILEALDDPKHRRYNHPATIMWRGYRPALVAYGCAVCDEWIERGGLDNQKEVIMAGYTTAPRQEDVPMPKWIGRESFHASHRGNLLRKDYQYYSAFGWTDSPLLPYEWPVNDDPRLFNFVRK